MVREVSTLSRLSVPHMVAIFHGCVIYLYHQHDPFYILFGTNELPPHVQQHQGTYIAVNVFRYVAIALTNTGSIVVWLTVGNDTSTSVYKDWKQLESRTNVLSLAHHRTELICITHSYAPQGAIATVCTNGVVPPSLTSYRKVCVAEALACGISSLDRSIECWLQYVFILLSLTHTSYPVTRARKMPLIIIYRRPGFQLKGIPSAGPYIDLSCGNIAVCGTLDGAVF
jgi:hypothetical protein